MCRARHTPDRPVEQQQKQEEENEKIEKPTKKGAFKRWAAFTVEMIKVVKLEQRNESDGEAQRPNGEHDDDRLMKLKSTQSQREDNRNESIHCDQGQREYAEFRTQGGQKAGKLTQSRSTPLGIVDEVDTAIVGVHTGDD